MEKVYDSMVSVALINMFTLSKEENFIKLCKFNRKDESHLALVAIGLMGRQVYGFDFGVVCSWLDIFWLRRKFKCKDIKKVKIGNIDCNKFILDIEEPNVKYGIFKQIYNAYYKVK